MTKTTTFTTALAPSSLTGSRQWSENVADSKWNKLFWNSGNSWTIRKTRNSYVKPANYRSYWKMWATYTVYRYVFCCNVDSMTAIFLRGKEKFKPRNYQFVGLQNLPLLPAPVNGDSFNSETKADAHHSPKLMTKVATWRAIAVAKLNFGLKLSTLQKFYCTSYIN